MDWNKCDECGRFISIQDFVSGAADRKFVTPDAVGTKETYENTCKLCLNHVIRKSPDELEIIQ